MNGWLEGRVVVPEVVGRGEWELEEAARDVEVLGWVARFRFVTAALVAQRLGVSVRRANAGLRRLEGVGLIERETGQVGRARAVWVSRRAWRYWAGEAVAGRGATCNAITSWASCGQPPGSSRAGPTRGC